MPMRPERALVVPTDREVPAPGAVNALNAAKVAEGRGGETAPRPLVDILPAPALAAVAHRFLRPPLQTLALRALGRLVHQVTGASAVAA